MGAYLTLGNEHLVTSLSGNVALRIITIQSSENS